MQINMLRSEEERGLLAALPPMPDRIDAWIGAGLLDGEALNAAGFMIAPSLALLAYCLDLRAGIEACPMGALIDRLLPESSPAAGWTKHAIQR
jgi:hypothetical protein